MARTASYQFTVRMKNGVPAAEDQTAIDALKSHIKWYNSQVKKEAGITYERTVGVRAIRIQLQGRLGKDNPAAAKYRPGGDFGSYQSIYLSDAQTADVYIYNR